MENSLDSTRQHKETCNGSTADTQESHLSRNAFEDETSRRKASWEERRTCTRRRTTDRESGNGSRSPEIAPRGLRWARLSRESTCGTARLRSRSSTWSCATGAAGTTGSVLGTRLETAESEPSGLVAVVDETEVKSGDGVSYVLVAVLLSESETAAQSMRELVFAPDRTRPFHWKKEGSHNQEGARQLIRRHAVGTYVPAQATSRSGTERARAALMAELVDRVANDGIDHLIIESRGTKGDDRDRAVVLDRLRGLASCEFSYQWSPKKEPLLWYADALAGASRDAVGNGACAPIAELQSDLITPRVEWIEPAQTNA